MAAYNDFITHNASGVKADVDRGVRVNGGVVRQIPFSFEKAADDIDASVWRVGRISPYAIIRSVVFACDAIASLTEIDIGFYKPKETGGDAIDKDCLKDGLDPHAGIAALTEEYVPDPANVGKEAYLIAGLTAAEAIKYGAFDIAITGNTAGTDIGSISGIIEYID